MQQPAPLGRVIPNTQAVSQMLFVRLEPRRAIAAIGSPLLQVQLKMAPLLSPPSSSARDADPSVQLPRRTAAALVDGIMALVPVANDNLIRDR